MPRAAAGWYPLGDAQGEDASQRRLRVGCGEFTAHFHAVGQRRTRSGSGLEPAISSASRMWRASWLPSSVQSAISTPAEASRTTGTGYSDIAESRAAAKWSATR